MSAADFLPESLNAGGKSAEALAAKQAVMLAVKQIAMQAAILNGSFAKPTRGAVTADAAALRIFGKKMFLPVRMNEKSSLALQKTVKEIPVPIFR